MMIKDHVSDCLNCPINLARVYMHSAIRVKGEQDASRERTSTRNDIPRRPSVERGAVHLSISSGPSLATASSRDRFPNSGTDEKCSSTYNPAGCLHGGRTCHRPANSLRYPVSIDPRDILEARSPSSSRMARGQSAICGTK